MALPPIDLSGGSSVSLLVSDLIVRYNDGGLQNTAYEAALDALVGVAGTPGVAVTYRSMTYSLSTPLSLAGGVDRFLLDLLRSGSGDYGGVPIVPGYATLIFVL